MMRKRTFRFCRILSIWVELNTEQLVLGSTMSPFAGAMQSSTCRRAASELGKSRLPLTVPGSGNQEL